MRSSKTLKHLHTWRTAYEARSYTSASNYQGPYSRGFYDGLMPLFAWVPRASPKRLNNWGIDTKITIGIPLKTLTCMAVEEVDLSYCQDIATFRI